MSNFTLDDGINFIVGFAKVEYISKLKNREELRYIYNTGTILFID
jgi:hypothetical protein